MQKQEFSPRRSKETTKPRVVCPKVIFYSCSHCGNLFQAYNPRIDAVVMCCNEEMKFLEEKDPSEVSDEVLIDYRITGGYNENTVEVFWKIKKGTITIDWIYLKTFTGGQLKYVTNPKKNSFVFAMADEDAYVYCDEDPCLECTFRCKRGFEIYIHIKEKGLIKMPMERMHANWQS
ncbi:hypothetical protein M2651_07810 [Clostridium sp. SYSU_GA19001]|uniref:hypothetical protein n=1 Tax=Clostridium caldaquaticum TaxID=2940653 RepID=UPI002076E4CC|nr:hypothetical protein [Clostridium caldaquaticum]MCM8710930.1 hypothetical protein [Clostridium caldaquaticum]